MNTMPVLSVSLCLPLPSQLFVSGEHEKEKVHSTKNKPKTEQESVRKVTFLTSQELEKETDIPVCFLCEKQN